jgi:hypothetical protein
MRRLPFDWRFTCFLMALAWILLGPPPLYAQMTVAPTGAYQTNVSIDVPRYYDIQPRLNLVYDSNIKYGVLGVGWRLSGLSEVKRVSPGRGAPRFDADDVYLLDGMELVQCRPGMTSPSCTHPAPGLGFVAYAFRTDTFQRVAFQDRPGGGLWQIWDKNGILRTYTPSFVAPRCRIHQVIQSPTRTCFLMAGHGSPPSRI